jgi:hypothetical protein
MWSPASRNPSLASLSTAAAPGAGSAKDFVFDALDCAVTREDQTRREVNEAHGVSVLHVAEIHQNRAALTEKLSDAAGLAECRAHHSNARHRHARQAAVRAVAADARTRLAGFGGLHWTPMRWLHMTVFLAGPAADIGQDARREMVARASSRLAATAPVVFDAAQAATREVTGGSGDVSAWIPHLTLCYSTSEQPAAPIIAALGKTMPPCEVTIDTLSLVVQNGPEPLWDWHRVGDARLVEAQRRSRPLRAVRSEPAEVRVPAPPPDEYRLADDG